MAKISRQSLLVGLAIPLIGVLLYPSLALNYPALPFNGITDLYVQYQHGHYYSPVMTQNMQAFRVMLEKYHSRHQQYPQNVKSLYEDAQAKGYWVYLKPISPNNMPAPPIIRQKTLSAAKFQQNRGAKFCIKTPKSLSNAKPCKANTAPTTILKRIIMASTKMLSLQAIKTALC